MAGGSFTYDLSIYYIDWSDIQVTLRDPATGFFYFANAGKAKSQGAELSLQYHNGSGTTIAANASINDAKLTRDPPAGSGAARDGDRLPLSSPFSGSIAVDHDVTLSGDSIAFFGGTLSYVGARRGNFVQNASDIRLRYRAYASVDLRAGVRQAEWTYSAYIANVGDKRGVIGGDPRALGGSSTAADAFYVNYIRPRTFGVSIAKAF